MRKSEEIKKALELCNMLSNRKNICESCPYNGECTPEDKPDQPGWDALLYIQQLEEQIMMMKIQMHGDCGVCKHRGGFDVEGAIMSQRCYECLRKETRPNWEYEGLPELARKESK